MSSHSDNLIVEPVARLIEALSRLPGIGPKSASRLAFYLLRADAQQARNLAQAIQAMKEQVTLCVRCFNITVDELCPVCASPTRDQTKICVVEEPLDVLAIERTAAFRGLYHVLHGHIAPLEGIYREDLKIEQLLARVRSEPVDEVILATNPNTEGDATAYLLLKDLAPLGVRVTRPGRGLPTGGDLEWADPATLGAALESRREL
ncbi:recombination mediator RecR [Candidatus Viridilinea mediisalina]|uniref:Recombination protein RecR n=1 Tax=Candidatus Viridilinea mediisalina TaxID=2024553 RepID=A0A2A6RKG7_9CHLR|nr:recombination mediator RecR [Candidatus Viridilinea mediisalina]PDW03395.1 recombination protein RecR [Candidatus Viridilinea mediisalina]